MRIRLTQKLSLGPRGRGTALALAFVLLSCVFATRSVAQEATAATWQVDKYDLAVTLPSGERERTISVLANLSLKNVSGRGATQLTLRMSPAAEVASIKVNGTLIEAARTEQTVTGTTTLQNRRARIPNVAPGASISVAVDYKLLVKDNTSLASLSPNGVRMLPLAFWYPTPNSWFYVRGADAAPTRIQVTGALGSGSVSTGTLTAGAFDQKFTVQPFFVTGNWDVVERSGVSIHMPKGAAAQRAEELAGIVVGARTFAAGYLGDAPATPLRVVSVSQGGGFASGGTILLDEAAFRRTKVDATTVMNLAEGAIRSWLGASTSVTGEGYGVIREGLTRYIATEFLESRYGKEIADVERLRQRSSYSGVSRRDGPLMRASPLDDFYFQAVANKGAMAWRLLERRAGKDDFRRSIKSSVADRDANMMEFRQAFAGQRELADYLFDQLTETNLLVGLPQSSSGETRVALRNTGSIDATVNVRATMQNGSVMESPATVKALSYGEISFRSASAVTRVEVDTEKLYPQTDYSDDIAPRESTDSDPVLAVKKLFDRKDFAPAEKLGKTILRDLPRLDEVRILLARAQLAQGKTAEADKEFQAILDEKLPTARSVGWALVGRAEVAAKLGSREQAMRFVRDALAHESDAGSSLAARKLRESLGLAGTIDASIRSFFADFDRIVKSNRKAEVESLFFAGEENRFVTGIAGSADDWKTEVRFTDPIDSDTALVETYTNLRLLTKDPEAGLVVYRLKRSGSSWKVASVDIFEVKRGS